MRFNWRYFLWIVVAGLTLLILLGPWQRERFGRKGLAGGPFGAYEADIVVDGLKYTHNIGDQPQWMLKADTAKMYQGRGIMYLKGVEINFFQKGGKKIVATADYGNYKVNSVLVLNGRVVVNLPSGQVLKTATLDLDQKKGLIWTKDRVVIRGNGLVMNGNGLEYDLKLGRLKVRSQTSAISSQGSMEF
ncbi:MAG: LPS export ABC transporter periplasmic protein LptC [Dissulfurimicrobium sp.]|uniref:LPS export ABC transporter periplasmic protein LptC n=1 Tax=Dissulfurimicrobium TaxID=1769732 RepID=UPI001EDBEDE2|nr:LPS export ABC transporter periplasmic protein LptC [Dissulfurimicrobium hydrothermale]UKL13515.1 LPS export ABC transporter periplasmic protein LptC [Dissulfurimicrobium hydrothermale]